jgi:hypothetical protein
MGRTYIVQPRAAGVWAPRSALGRGRLSLILVAAITAALLVAAPALAGGSKRVGLAKCDPDRRGFTIDVDNPYYPLPVGQRLILTGIEEGENLGLRITVLDQTATMVFESGEVATRVLEEVEWVDTDADGILDSDEDLIEISFNYIAQTRAGTVCYFGELVDIYEDGIVVSHEGSWRADAPGTRPGILMPAEPRVGMRFRQELAPGIAEDRARIINKEPVTVPAGTYRKALRTREVNPLDGDVGFKVFARGVGLIVDGPLQLIRVEHL